MTMYKGQQKVFSGNNVYPWLFSYSVIQPKTPLSEKNTPYIYRHYVSLSLSPAGTRIYI